MISAKDALNLTMEARKDTALDKYEQLIKEAARDGHRRVRVEYLIPTEQTKALEKLGFEVIRREDDENALSVIRW